MVKTWMWIVGVIAIVVVIIVVIIVMTSLTSSTSSTSSTPPTPPSSITITWFNNITNTIVMPLIIPENCVFTLTSGTSLESYNVGLSNMMSFISPEGFTVKYIYEITREYPDVQYFDASKVVFIKYVDSADANRFALVLVASSSEGHNLIIRTENDVGTLIDPTTYNGNWVSSNDFNVIVTTNETLYIS